MAQNNDDFDPLASFDSVPAVSFDPGKPDGIPEKTWAELEVTGYIKLVQAKDDNGKPKFYEDSGKEVMKSVLPVRQNGEDRALWAKKNWVEGGLFRALAEAQKELGHRIGEGTTLEVRWRWDTTKQKKLGNYPKAYEVRATSQGAPPAKGDPLAESPSTPRASDPWGVDSQPSSSEPPF